MEGPEGPLLLPCSVVRQGEFSVGSYRRREDALEQTEPERTMSPAQLSGMLAASEDRIALGPAIRSYRAELESLGAPARQLRSEAEYPSALAIAKLTVFPAAQDLKELFALEPHYIRSSEAERNPAFPPLPGPPPSARILDR